MAPREHCADARGPRRYARNLWGLSPLKDRHPRLRCRWRPDCIRSFEGVVRDVKVHRGAPSIAAVLNVCCADIQAAAFLFPTPCRRDASEVRDEESTVSRTDASAPLGRGAFATSMAAAVIMGTGASAAASGKVSAKATSVQPQVAAPTAAAPAAPPSASAGAHGGIRRRYAGRRQTRSLDYARLRQSVGHQDGNAHGLKRIYRHDGPVLSQSQADRAHHSAKHRGRDADGRPQLRRDERFRDGSHGRHDREESQCVDLQGRRPEFCRWAGACRERRASSTSLCRASIASIRTTSTASRSRSASPFPPAATPPRSRSFSCPTASAATSAGSMACSPARARSISCRASSMRAIWDRGRGALAIADAFRSPPINRTTPGTT